MKEGRRERGKEGTMEGRSEGRKEEERKEDGREIPLWAGSNYQISEWFQEKQWCGCRYCVAIKSEGLT